MEASELRIGNLVKPQNGDFTKIDASFFSTLYEWESTPEYYRYKEHPFSAWSYLPLTEEWLLKLGFEFRYIDDTCGEYRTHITNKEWGIFAFDVNSNGYSYTGYAATYSVKLEFVHQLQNLYFALTGEELTIKETVVV